MYLDEGKTEIELRGCVRKANPESSTRVRRQQAKAKLKSKPGL